MSPHLRNAVLWSPRLLGLVLTAFVALFATNALDGRPIAQGVAAFLMNLIPAGLVGLALAAGWRFPWAGAAMALGLAAVYAAMVPNRLDWMLVIAGPLVLLAALFGVTAAVGQHRGA